MDYKNNPKRAMNKERAKKFTQGFMGEGSVKDRLMSGLGLGQKPAAKEMPKKKK